MRINPDYEARNIGGINIVVPVGGNMSLTGVITLNESALFIWNCLTEDITEEELIEKVCNEYDAPKDVITNDVKEILVQFKQNNLIV